MSNYQPYVPSQATPPGWSPGDYQGYGTQPAADPQASAPASAPASAQPTSAYPPPMSAYPQQMSPYSSAYPMMPARSEHPQATTVLVLGILGFFVSVTGPIAWAIGNKARRECASGMYVETDALRIGRILGIITSILLIVGIGTVVLYFLLVIGMWITIR